MTKPSVGAVATVGVQVASFAPLLVRYRLTVSEMPLTMTVYSNAVVLLLVSKATPHPSLRSGPLPPPTAGVSSRRRRQNR